MEAQASIFPGYMAPVVRRAEDGDQELVKLSWGFVLLRDGYAPKRVTNVRDDHGRRSRSPVSGAGTMGRSGRTGRPSSLMSTGSSP